MSLPVSGSGLEWSCRCAHDTRRRLPERPTPGCGGRTSRPLDGALLWSPRGDSHSRLEDWLSLRNLWLPPEMRTSVLLPVVISPGMACRMPCALSCARSLREGCSQGTRTSGPEADLGGGLRLTCLCALLLPSASSLSVEDEHMSSSCAADTALRTLPRLVALLLPRLLALLAV